MWLDASASLWRVVFQTLSEVLKVSIPAQFCCIFLLVDRRLHSSLIIQRALYQISYKTALLGAGLLLGLGINPGQRSIASDPGSRSYLLVLASLWCVVSPSLSAPEVAAVMTWPPKKPDFLHVSGLGYGVCAATVYCRNMLHFHNLISYLYSLGKCSNFQVSGSYQGHFRIRI